MSYHYLLVNLEDFSLDVITCEKETEMDYLAKNVYKDSLIYELDKDVLKNLKQTLSKAEKCLCQQVLL